MANNAIHDLINYLNAHYLSSPGIIGPSPGIIGPSPGIPILQADLDIGVKAVLESLRNRSPPKTLSIPKVLDAPMFSMIFEYDWAQ